MDYPTAACSGQIINSSNRYVASPHTYVSHDKDVPGAYNVSACACIMLATQTQRGMPSVKNECPIPNIHKSNQYDSMHIIDVMFGLADCILWSNTATVKHGATRHFFRHFTCINGVARNTFVYTFVFLTKTQFSLGTHTFYIFQF